MRAAQRYKAERENKWIGRMGNQSRIYQIISHYWYFLCIDNEEESSYRFIDFELIFADWSLAKLWT